MPYVVEGHHHPQRPKSADATLLHAFAESVLTLAEAQ